jgi:hypothetical protein
MQPSSRTFWLMALSVNLSLSTTNTPQNFNILTLLYGLLSSHTTGTLHAQCQHSWHTLHRQCQYSWHTLTRRQKILLHTSRTEDTQAQFVPNTPRTVTTPCTVTKQLLCLSYSRAHNLLHTPRTMTSM